MSQETEIIAQRRLALNKLREQNKGAYPNDFRRDALSAPLKADYDHLTKDELAKQDITVNVAGRMMTRRVMGKAAFAHIQDMSGRIQIYLRRDELAQGCYEDFKNWDIGDIIAVKGKLFKTKTDELSVHVIEICLMAKSLRPLPEKFHGVTDKELRYRKRYLDLMMNEDTRKVFLLRSQVVNYIRQFLLNDNFIEVETPMMHIIPGGATAKPFITHHNSLDMPLYLRIAPELYLKQLVVGGFEKVFEINRNFRNEGLSTTHNPEFTMLEFYQAFADYHDLMQKTEALFSAMVKMLCGQSLVTYQGHTIDFSSPFKVMSLVDSIIHFNPDIKAHDLDNIDAIRAIAKQLAVDANASLAKIQLELFEKTVEPKLIQPTFITEYPTEVSPLARQNDEQPLLSDRFELFIGGFEIANGFSELNDPEEQALRFDKQVAEKKAGDEEAMYYDQNYITALEYGLPPTAGEGIGIDRLVMLLTDSASIRDVILFPHMRSQSG